MTVNSQGKIALEAWQHGCMAGHVRRLSRQWCWFPACIPFSSSVFPPPKCEDNWGIPTSSYPHLRRTPGAWLDAPHLEMPGWSPPFLRGGPQPTPDYDSGRKARSSFLKLGRFCGAIYALAFPLGSGEEGQPLKSHLDSFFPLPSPALHHRLTAFSGEHLFHKSESGSDTILKKPDRSPTATISTPTQVPLSVKTTSSEFDFGGCWKEPWWAQAKHTNKRKHRR